MSPPISSRRIARGLGVLWLCALAGCGTSWSRTARAVYTPTDRPVASVTSARVTQSTDHGARVEVTLAIQNPNGFVLDLERMHYQLSVGGDEERAIVFRGSAPVALPAEDRQTLILAAAFPGRSAQPGSAYSVSGSFTYQPPGGLRAFASESGLPLPSLRFSHRGTLE